MKNHCGYAFYSGITFCVLAIVVTIAKTHDLVPIILLSIGSLNLTFNEVCTRICEAIKKQG